MATAGMKSTCWPIRFSLLPNRPLFQPLIKLPARSVGRIQGRDPRQPPWPGRAPGVARLKVTRRGSRLGSVPSGLLLRNGQAQVFPLGCPPVTQMPRKIVAGLQQKRPEHIQSAGISSVFGKRNTERRDASAEVISDGCSHANYFRINLLIVERHARPADLFQMVFELWQRRNGVGSRSL